MTSYTALFLLVVSSFTINSGVHAKDELEKWGKDIDWLDDYAEGFRRAEKLNKPVFIMIWRTWCDACKGLADKVKKHKDFKNMSKKFIMVNVWTEKQEPWFEEFEANKDSKPHVPRVHFATPNGKLITNVKCDDPRDDENFTFYYSKVDTMVKGMEIALAKFKKMPKPEKSKTEEKAAEKSQEKKEEKTKEDKKPKDGKKQKKKSEL